MGGRGDWCCLCGGEEDVRYCGACDHYFCAKHRDFWNATGVWERGVAAVKEWIGKNGGTPFCERHRDYPPVA